MLYSKLVILVFHLKTKLKLSPFGGLDFSYLQTIQVVLYYSKAQDSLFPILCLGFFSTKKHNKNY